MLTRTDFTAEAKSPLWAATHGRVRMLLRYAPTRKRKEHTSTKCFNCVPGWRAGSPPAVILYLLNFPTASDWGHFIYPAGSLV